MHPFRSAIETGDPDAALELVSPEVVFNGPDMFRRYHGREAVAVILRAAARVLDEFHYEREIGAAEASDHALVFRARIGDRQLQGCDFLHLGEDGLINELTVMIRPASGALALAAAMDAEVPTVGRELGVTVA
jgi:hypothetical protein